MLMILEKLVLFIYGMPGLPQLLLRINFNKSKIKKIKKSELVVYNLLLCG